MTQDTWTAVDTYINKQLIPQDDALLAAVRASDAAGLPAIQVSPSQGKLLYVLAKAQGAKNILELGTLGGYSTIWLARALPRDGHLITLEFSQKHADVAKVNIARAGVADKVEILVGRAIETLPKLAREGRGPFDLIFIDADKPSYPEYFEWALKLSRPGTLMIADNVIRKGAVADPTAEDARTQGVRRFFETVGAEPRVSATGIQTVGSKGYDGFVMIVVNSN